MPARHSRVPAWFTLFASATLLLAACQGQGTSNSPGASGSGSSPSAAPSVKEPDALTVLEWSGYEDPKFWTDFQTASPSTAVDFSSGSVTATSSQDGGQQGLGRHLPLYTGWQQFYVDEGLVRRSIPAS